MANNTDHHCQISLICISEFRVFSGFEGLVADSLKEHNFSLYHMLSGPTSIASCRESIVRIWHCAALFEAAQVPILSLC